MKQSYTQSKNRKENIHTSRDKRRAVPASSGKERTWAVTYPGTDVRGAAESALSAAGRLLTGAAAPSTRVAVRPQYPSIRTLLFQQSPAAPVTAAHGIDALESSRQGQESVTAAPGRTGGQQAGVLMEFNTGAPATSSPSEQIWGL